jgi:hypothetical protein
MHVLSSLTVVTKVFCQEHKVRGRDQAGVVSDSLHAAWPAIELGCMCCGLLFG